MDIYAKIVLLCWIWFFAITVLDIMLKNPIDEYPWLGNWAILNMIGMVVLLTKVIINL